MHGPHDEILNMFAKAAGPLEIATAEAPDELLLTAQNLQG